MAKEKEDKFGFSKYELAQLAKQYADKEDFGRADIALKNTPLDADGKLLIEKDPHYNTNAGVASASKLYGDKFSNGLYGQKISDLLEFYDGSFKGLSDTAKSDVIALFKEYGSKTLASVSQEYIDALTIVKDPESYKRQISKYVAKEDLDETVKTAVKNAQKTKEKLAPLISVRELLQEKRFSGLENMVRDKAIERTAKREA